MPCSAPWLRLMTKISTWHHFEFMYYRGILLIGSICCCTGGRKPDLVPTTQFAELILVKSSQQWGVHPRLGFRCNPVIVELRQADSGYTAQSWKMKKNKRKTVYFSIYSGTTILVSVLSSERRGLNLFHRPNMRNDVCRTVSIMWCLPAFRFSIQLL